MAKRRLSAAAQEWTNADDGGFGGDAAHHGMALTAASRGEIAEADPRASMVGVAAQARPRSRGFAIEPRLRRASPLRASIADAEQRVSSCSRASSEATHQPRCARPCA
ncbi:MAG: hypothetical protein A4S17_11365 [Proteobacteria bacterium HN_bin10]|nr:MAG: hypothetical protein A4S17_11365 [Proteobacteria bacterium HN_bin10]